MSAPSGTTRVAAVVGDPVAHSRSPAIHNAAFRALGLDWLYVAFRVAPGEGAAIVPAMRALGLAGVSVTMPHKDTVARCADRRSPVVDRLGAANTLRWEAGSIVAESTDGEGLLDALEVRGIDPAGRRVLVVGAGGAARAIILALAGRGAILRVAARRPGAAAEAAALGGSLASVARAEDAGDSDIVVNATPQGMAGRGEPATLVVPASCIGRGQVVVETIYHPLVTPLVGMARARGATVLSGDEMLLHQGARQLTMWTGERAPVEEMRRALGASLGT